MKDKLIQNGSIKGNTCVLQSVYDDIIDNDFVLKDNMVIKNQVHRHEFPVPAVKIEIIYQNKDMVVIDKPPGIPIIFTVFKSTNILGVHRLDRFTSGVLIFAKSPSYAAKISSILRLRDVAKVYLCKVQGEFPQSINCTEPILQASFKFALCLVSVKGKLSETFFKRLHFDGENSYVACIKLHLKKTGYPKTGRMHQLRVHLQFLGFPIIGDPVYSHPVAFGANQGKGGVEEANVTQEKSSRGCVDSESVSTFLEKKEINYPPKFKDFFKEDCDDCNNPIPIFYPKHQMLLHSYSYKVFQSSNKQFDEFVFTTSFPAWINDVKSNIDFNNIIDS
ncbi:hypothetical protein MXB_5288 [Myxobolus squamalis]|nr:hypothetical protein MXB_5288 [Myxobolus squamalis]